MQLNRRAFFRTVAAFSTSGAGLLAYTALVEPHWLEIVKRDLPIANLPRELHGATLAQVSDIHACSYVEEKYLVESFQRLKALSPDLVVVTGDFVTWEIEYSPTQKLAQLQRVLSYLPHGRLGTLAVLGNHDYGRDWREPGVAQSVASVANSVDIHVLRNEVTTISGLDVIGVDDLWAGTADTKKALAKRVSSAAIALCHNPDAVDELPWDGYSGWILAGHTHGGQCKPPFLPPPVLPVKNKRYTSGAIRVDRTRTLYISRGVGHLLPVRFNVRPEITLFSMRAG
ncbi:MAG TPA: metallophosphoesterase [Gemmatimonadaceae bacterium]|nr:metallophosphoesterase [Gemmatimonadaceae bacterium]